MILMLIYVVPRFESFFKEMGQTLYWSTRFLLGLSTAFRSYWWLAGLLLAAPGLAGGAPGPHSPGPDDPGPL